MYSSLEHLLQEGDRAMCDLNGNLVEFTSDLSHRSDTYDWLSQYMHPRGTDQWNESSGLKITFKQAVLLHIQIVLTNWVLVRMRKVEPGELHVDRTRREL